MATYIALLRKDAESDFGVDFPDFPGCVTAGATLEEARLMAAEALEFHIEGMTQDRLPIPAPTPLDQIMADPDNWDAVAFLVDAPIRPVRAIRVNVTLPEDVLEQIDKAAKNRSKFLTDAARAHLREIA